jgi:amino acid adenylation domain-containing protein
MRALSFLSGSSDVTTGLVSNVRPEAADGDKVLGLFLNTLPLRTRTAGGSWRELVRATYDAELAVIAHRHYPYFQLYLDNGRLPYYDAIFNYINFHVYDEAGSDGAIGVLGSLGYEATGHAFAVTFSHTGGKLQLKLTAAQLTAAGLERVRGYYLTILRTMADDPDAMHGGQELLAPEEVARLHGFNPPATEYAGHLTVHQVFEARAAAQPGATALVEGDMRITYAELDRLANRLAHRLIGLGLRPEQRVAVCLERGIALAVALLGVLKAGGAYVMLDTAHPPQRLADVLEDSAAIALLTAPRLRAGFGELALPVLALDADGGFAAAAALPAHCPDPHALQLTPRHLAYVNYTSGSTGKPKGVMIEHRGILRLVINNPALQICPADRVALCANPAFDATTLELWGALLHGAALVVVPQPVLLDPSSLLALLQAEQVNVLHLTAGLFQQYAEPLAPLIPSLKYLLFGGDQVDVNAVARVLRNGPPATLCNCYGPTEATTLSSMYPITALPEGASSVPIGRPLANTRIYVLDAHGCLAPVGVPGELYVGGPGVARGYLNLAQLSAERFVPDPFGADPEARLYRTGDLARWRPDGNLEFLGRNDLQVKIRGFRVEPGDIEARLSNCAGVREAVVLARADSSGRKRLVAYCVAQPGVTLAPQELRRELSATLADYMVPAAFVNVACLPLTPNGKVDRKALPEPDERALATRHYEAPRDEVEVILADLWSTLLGAERVSRHDHFFELGGHSLLAVQLAVRLRERFQVDIPLTTLFERAVLSEQAESIVSAQLALFHRDDIERLEEELDGLSEEELRAILAETTTNE